MRSRIAQTFSTLGKKGKKAFIPYIMAGDPSLEKTEEIVLLFEKCGADIVELGVPFSDPVADGTTIQRASERALHQGVTLRKTLASVRKIRIRTSIPLILMTYFNPVFQYDLEAFVDDASKAGIDGVIIPDLPPDEASDLIPLARRARLDTIFLLAPTSTKERIRKVAKASTGFIYYVSITGITGSSLLLDGSIDAHIGKIRTFTDTPVAVGFGISTPHEAAAVASCADGIIVGSALVKKCHEAPDELESLLRGLREAIR